MLILELLIASVMISNGARPAKSRTCNTLTHDKEKKSFVHATRRAMGGKAFDVRDGVHSSIYEYLSKAHVVEESADEGSSSPEHLTVKANGRELEWDSDSREGRVNPNRLRISVRWAALLLQLHVNAAKLAVQLTDTDEQVLCSASLVDGVPHLLHQSDQLERLEDGLAVACHALPENVQLQVLVQVQAASNDGERKKAWTVETADLSSGDAQGRIMFLPPDYNVSELQRKHGALASVIVTKEGLEKRLVAKEVTIFDADERDSNEPQMDIRVNGFEFDTSRDLSGAVQAFQEQLHGSPEEEARQETYDFSTERWRIEKCGLLTQEDLDAWVQAAKKHSEGKLSPTELPCREKWALDYTYEVSQTSRFVSFGQKCRQKDTDKYELECNETVEPDHISSKELELPVQVEFGQKPWTTEQKLTRPMLGLVGVQLSVVSQETREQVMRSLATKPERVDNQLVKVANPMDAKAALDIVKASADAAQKLVEAMEQRSSQWWTRKKGFDVKSACFSVNYRHTRGGMKGLPVAHIDAINVAEWFKPGGVFPTSSQGRVNDVLGMKLKDALKHVVLTFNEWINAGPETIIELPLTIMDTKTLDEKDIEMGWLQAGLDSKMVRWSEAQRWYYRNLKPGEGYMFITSPHVGRHRTFTGTPHSAFRFIRKENATASRPRQSFEFRCLVMDKNWTSPAKLLDDKFPEASMQEQIRSGANSMMAAMIMDGKALMESMQDNDEMVRDESS